MQPDLAVGFGAVGQQRIVGVFTIGASETAPGRRAFGIAVQPFDDATGKGLGLGLGTRQSAIEPGHTGAFVKEDMPVFSRPPVSSVGRSGAKTSVLSSTRRSITAARGRHRRRQNHVFAVDTELDAGYVGCPESLNRAHIRPLQPVTVFSTDGVQRRQLAVIVGTHPQGLSRRSAVPPACRFED